MSLSEEIFEWRKQMVEKLLIDGRNLDDIKEQVNAAEILVFGDYTVNVSVECPIKHSSELKELLLDFSERNGCLLAATSSVSTA